LPWSVHSFPHLSSGPDRKCSVALQCSMLSDCASCGKQFGCLWCLDSPNRCMNSTDARSCSVVARACAGIFLLSLYCHLVV
jgi:hypothetical protein